MTQTSSGERAVAPDAELRLRSGQTLVRIALLTTLLAAGALAIALPLRRNRESRMMSAARAELASVVGAVEEFRAQQYRLPDSLEELERSGYSAPPSIDICAFRYVTDPRGFDNHLEIAVRHRAARSAVLARHPGAGTRAREIDAGEACDGNAVSAAATRGWKP